MINAFLILIFHIIHYIIPLVDKCACENVVTLKQKPQRTCDHKLLAYGDCRYVVTERSRTEISKLVFQCVEVSFRMMENSPSNYGRESMTLFSSVPNGSRMNVIWARAPSSRGPLVFSSSASLLSPYCSSPVAFSSRKKKTGRLVVEPTDFYLNSVVSIPRLGSAPRNRDDLKKICIHRSRDSCVTSTKGGQEMNNHEPPDRRRSLHGSRFRPNKLSRLCVTMSGAGWHNEQLICKQRILNAKLRGRFW